MSMAHIITDYLVIGAGISGLCFVDELLTRTNASITIVDRRDAPGGHWNDSYPFVKLHQPSTFYGVGSTELSDYRIDTHGLNKGFQSLASGAQVISYCHKLMQERLIPSGRVTFYPLTEYQSDGTLRGLLSGTRTTVTVRKRLVDASLYTNEIPLNHKRSFTVEKSVTCIPPNDLPRLARNFDRYTVLGGGKTAMDTCLWLLANGVAPDRLRWVIPNDYWYFNRAKFQTGPEFFLDVCNSFADRMEIISCAGGASDYALRMEKAGIWLRLDSNVEPSMFHAAVMSEREVTELRKIHDVVRQGYVKRLEASRMMLTKGSIQTLPNTLYIDCTASAIDFKPVMPIFQPGKIVLQMIRYPQIPFSAAIVAYLESLTMEDSERNSLTNPVAFGKTVEDYVAGFAADLQNSVRTAKHPQVRGWVKQSRLDGFSPTVSIVQPHETEKVAALKRLRAATAQAYVDLPRLMATVRSRAML